MVADSKEQRSGLCKAGCVHHGIYENKQCWSCAGARNSMRTVSDGMSDDDEEEEEEEERI